MCFVETMNLDGETNLKQKQLALRSQRPPPSSRPRTSLENTLTSTRGPSPRLKNLSGIQEEVGASEQTSPENTLEPTIDSTTTASALVADSDKQKKHHHRHRSHRHREHKTSVTSAPRPSGSNSAASYSRSDSVMSVASVDAAVEPFDPFAFKWKLVCDGPNEKLDQFTGKLYVPLQFTSIVNWFAGKFPLLLLHDFNP